MPPRAPCTDLKLFAPLDLSPAAPDCVRGEASAGGLIVAGTTRVARPCCLQLLPNAARGAGPRRCFRWEGGGTHPVQATGALCKPQGNLVPSVIGLGSCSGTGGHVIRHRCSNPPPAWALCSSAALWAAGGTRGGAGGSRAGGGGPLLLEGELSMLRRLQACTVSWDRHL